MLHAGSTPSRLVLALLATVVVARARAGSLTEVEDFGANPGGLAMYLYLPDAPAMSPAAVVALHGCGQTAADYLAAGWNTLAEAHGFVVVYPQQSPVNNYYRCFTWWGGELVRGADENQSIKDMVDHVVANHAVDPSRVYVTGLSAGGAVAVNLLALWPDVFAAAGVVAGIPFGCATSLGATSACISPGVDRSAAAWGQAVRDARAGGHIGPSRISLWQGTQDSVVASANLAELTEQWLDVHGLSAAPSVDETAGLVRRQLYRSATGADLVEVVTLQGVDHGTPVDPQAGCGEAGAYFLDLELCAALRMAEFFGLVEAAAVDGGAGDAGARDAAGADAGVGVDANPTGDAGGRDDAANPADAAGVDRGAAGADATLAEAGVRADTTGSGRPLPPGCGCVANPSSSAGPLGVILGLLGAVVRRRGASVRRGQAQLDVAAR